MSLTLGSGPLASGRSGFFNSAVSIAGRVLYFEPAPARVRGIFAGETIVDSQAVWLLHEGAAFPQWYFPRSDVRWDLLDPGAVPLRCPLKGEATVYSLRVGDRCADNVAWSYGHRPTLGFDLSNYVSFHFSMLDEWWEEGERVQGHPRDPYHRVDVMRTSRQVVVSYHGQELARSIEAEVAYETGLPPRYYLPMEDVALELLEPTGSVSYCPYKGEAFHWRLRGGENIAWTYYEPRLAVAPLEDLVAFHTEWVDLKLDGQLQPRPLAGWFR